MYQNFAGLPPGSSRGLKLFVLILLGFLPQLLIAQNKVVSFTVNPTSLVINGSTFTAKTMLAPGLIRAIGKPDAIDTLQASQLKTLNDLMMATLNKYSNNGLMLLQGKNTERVNSIMIFPSPLPSKRYIDYVNTPFRGKLTLLGFRIDSNTTIDQAQKALAKYNFDLSEEYTSGDFTVYDPVNQARLLEVRMNFIPASRKIEYIDIKLFPARAAVKQVIEYKGGQMYLGGILLDTAANKALQLKKLLGPATFVFDVRYSTAGGITYNARRHHYIYIAGLSFVENPFNQSLLMLQIDFLTTRAKHDLGNPLFELVINKKKFDPENAVPNGPDNVKSHYGLDSVSKQVVESDNKTYVSSTSKYGKLEFEFAGKYNFERRVHFVNYYLNTVRSQAETDAEPATKPAVVVREGLMSMANNKGSFSWDSSLPPTEALKTIIGEPDITTATGVSEYNRQGIRLWTKDGKIYSIQFYLDNYINAYSGNNDSPGLFTGSIQVDGRSLTTSSTVEYAKQALTSYNLQKAYDDKNHTVYRGTYKGTTLYLTFLLSGKRLISVSVNK